jgi:exoribonuclease-2
MRPDLVLIAYQAMVDRGLRPEFTAAEMAETRGLSTQVGPLGDAQDLRGLLWASIDNDDSRDLDQLSYAEALSAGAIRIRVAIADVDSKVPQGSPLDEHAMTNTTSVYTDARVFPMLPEILSTDLTSLNQGQERWALVIEMEIDATGQVRGERLYRAVVVNRAKLAYGAVAAWLEGRAEPPPQVAAVPGLAENLQLQDRVAQALRRRRYQRGALDLDVIEPRAVFDGDAVADLRVDPQNRAQQLIEDLMIAANLATARFLDDQGFPSLPRVLRSPERWARIVELAGAHGTQLPGEPDGPALEAFLIERRHKDPERFPDLSLAVVKLLGRGEYAVGTPGQQTAEHFGLAVQNYGHATAPNRRFPDLVTQRLVKAALARRPVPYGSAELAALAQRCTVGEESAAKVERQVRKSAAAMLLERRIGERFEGLVTGASAKGTWVRLLRPPVEGRVIRGFEGLDVGDRVTVKLEHTDVLRGFIDFSRVR